MQQFYQNLFGLILKGLYLLVQLELLVLVQELA